MSRHTRRSFLVQAIASLSAGALPGCGGEAPPHNTISEPDAGTAEDASVLPDAASDSAGAERLYFAADDLDAVYDLGMRYLAALAIPLTAAAVREAARSTVGLIESASTDSAAVSALVERVRDDFQRDVTLDLDGWVLSRTELDLCALCLFA
jgi:hypothetical protein